MGGCLYLEAAPWEYEPERNQYYLHLFAKEQPDLNWTVRRPEKKSLILSVFGMKKG